MGQARRFRTTRKILYDRTYRSVQTDRAELTFELRGAALFAASLSNDLLGCIPELSIEICLMLNIRLAGNEFTMALQAANAEPKSILR